jgi:tRNA(adenine34) deaminase
MPPTQHHFDAGDLDTWMAAAMVEATVAGDAGEVPIGCVVIHLPTFRIVGRGQNRRERDEDPTAHAEVVALRDAGRTLGTWRMVDCALVVTLEPCPMCAGAIVNARCPHLVYGCADAKAGAVDTLMQLCSDPRLNHRATTIIAGVRADACRTLLTDFFRRQRAAGKK